MKRKFNYRDVRRINRIYPTIRIPIDNEKSRVGITDHLVERLSERVYGLSLEKLEIFLNNENTICYNPEQDIIPHYLTLECKKNLYNKHIKYENDCRLYLIPSEDLVVVLNKDREWDSSRSGREKPFFWNDWVLVSMWKQFIFEIDKMETEPTFVKVNGRRVYLK